MTTTTSEDQTTMLGDFHLMAQHFQMLSRLYQIWTRTVCQMRALLPLSCKQTVHIANLSMSMWGKKPQTLLDYQLAQYLTSQDGGE